jgi:hypothetical protein
MLARARVPGPEVQPLEDLADGHPLVDQPAVEHAHEGGFVLVDLEPSAGPVAARDVAVAVRCTSADEPAGPRLLQLAAAEALAEQRPLVFGHHPWICGRSWSPGLSEMVWLRKATAQPARRNSSRISA